MSLFCFSSILQDNSLIEETIPNLVTDNINSMLTMLPSMEEIHNAVFNMNKEGAPGPDGFGAIFFQSF